MLQLLKKRFYWCWTDTRIDRKLVCNFLINGSVYWWFKVVNCIMRPNQKMSYMVQCVIKMCFPALKECFFKMLAGGYSWNLYFGSMSCLHSAYFPFEVLKEPDNFCLLDGLHPLNCTQLRVCHPHQIDFIFDIFIYTFDRGQDKTTSGYLSIGYTILV